jgi:hypothetical protein
MSTAVAFEWDDGLFSRRGSGWPGSICLAANVLRMYPDRRIGRMRRTLAWAAAHVGIIPREEHFDYDLYGGLVF